ncbi:hypothetical protein FKP32DRAFT_1674668 [Trametes sanguinea]|nr:hypothetical protein FKP32DRAFT_1674668 [Trametes sanguinea]
MPSANYEPKIGPGSRGSRYREYKRGMASVGEELEDPVTYFTRKEKVALKNLGKLRQVLDLPMDVFFEVAAHLQPLDILQLSRVSKELREVLLSRHHRYVWIAALRNVTPALPRCPSYLNEPQFARVVFDHVCMACGASRAINVDYAFGMRFCACCWRANMRKGSALTREAKVPKDKQEAVLKCMPFAKAEQTCVIDKEAGLMVAVKRDPARLYYEPRFKAVWAEICQYLMKNDDAGLAQYTKESNEDAMVRFDVHFRSLCDAGKFQSSDLGGKEIMPLERNGPQLEREKRARVAERKKWKPRREQLLSHYKKYLQTGCDGLSSHLKRTMPCPADARGLPSMEVLIRANHPEEGLSEEEFAATIPALLEDAEAYRVKMRRRFAELIRYEYSGEAVEAPSLGTSDPEHDHSDSESASHAASEEERLLALPSSVFACYGGCPHDGYPPTRLSFAGFLQHWQEVHPTKHISQADVVALCANEEEVAKELLPALGLDENASMDEVEALARSGTFVCDCGISPWREQRSTLGAVEKDYHALDDLLHHIRYARLKPGQQHRITFKSSSDATVKEGS